LTPPDVIQREFVTVVEPEPPPDPLMRSEKDGVVVVFPVLLARSRATMDQP
jgi:hypothetical protein